MPLHSEKKIKKITITQFKMKNDHLKNQNSKKKNGCVHRKSTRVTISTLSNSSMYVIVKFLLLFFVAFFILFFFLL